MAYLFQNVDSDGEDPGKSNIFGGQQSQQQTTTGEGQGGAIEKGGAGDQSMSGGQTAARGGGKAPSSAVYNPKEISKSFQSASLNVRAPQKLTQAEGSLAQGAQNLQEKANAYTQKAAETAKSYDVSDETLRQAAEGQSKPYETVANRMKQSGPGLFESFQGLGKDEPDVGYVQDLGNLYRSEAGPAYTSGQSRFDAALLGRNPEVIARQRKILDQQEALRSQNQKAIDEQTKAAQENLGKAWQTSTENLKGRIGNLANETIAQAKAREAEIEAQRAKIDPASVGKLETDRLRQQIKEALSKADPRSEEYRALKFLSDDFDIQPYLNIDKDVDWKEVLTQEEADRYNRLQGLAGGNEILQAGKGAGDPYSVTGEAYNALLDQIRNKRREADVKGQSELDAIMQAAEQRAAGYNARDVAQDARAQAMNELSAYARSKGMTDQEIFQNPRLYQDLLEQGLVRENTAPADWRSVLLGSEVARLNELNQDLGGMDQFTEGGYRDEIESDRLRKYYDDYIASHLGKYKSRPEVIQQSQPAIREKQRFSNVR